MGGEYEGMRYVDTRKAAWKVRERGGQEALEAVLPLLRELERRRDDEAQDGPPRDGTPVVTRGGDPGPDGDV